MPVALAAIPAAIGLYQVLFSGKRKARRKLENAIDNSPQYGGNSAINQYYNEAYNRYMTAPTDTALYKTASGNIERSSANAISNLQDRRGALESVGQIVAANNQAYNNAVVGAERQREQRFGELGNAAGMKSSDDMQRFNINTLMPYQQKLSLLSTKLAGANQTFNAGIQNISNAASSLASSYGGKGSGGGGSWGFGGGGGGASGSGFTQYGAAYNPNYSSVFQTQY